MGNDIFAARIKKLREEHGESQGDLAKLSGYQKQAVSHWETSGKVPRSNVLKLLADHYETTTDYLLGANEKKAPTAPYICERSMTPEEKRLLDQFREMEEDQKHTILKVVENFRTYDK